MVNLPPRGIPFYDRFTTDCITETSYHLQIDMLVNGVTLWSIPIAHITLIMEGSAINLVLLRTWRYGRDCEKGKELA